MIRISSNRYLNIIDKLENGKTYRSVAEGLGVSVSTIYRWSIRNGKSPRWKRELNNERKAEQVVEISKALCVIPNLRRVCKEKNIGYDAFISKNDFRARKIGCYKTARNKCRMCGIDITNRTWWQRLCKEHKVSEEMRQHKLRVHRGKARQTRVHSYFTGGKKLSNAL